MILYMYKAPGQGQTAPREQSFDVNRNVLSLHSLVASFKKISVKPDFIQFFSWFNICIKPRGRGRQPPGDKILMSTEMSCHFIHLLQVSKKSLWSLILYNFFHDFIHVYSPKAGADNPLGTKFLCQREHLVTLVICCKFQKNLFEVRFYTVFFMILYMYIAPGQGQIAPRGQNFERPYHFTLLLQVSKKSLWSLVLYNFSHDLIHVYVPGTDGIQPPGDKVLISTETSCHFGHLLLVSNHTRE